jgi:hypothetical protein
VFSITSAYVTLTRCEGLPRAHARPLPFDPARPQAEKHKDLIEHLTSDASLLPKDDAQLFEETVRRTGGPNTPWAKAVRREIEEDGDPLRQQHRAEMNERFQARAYAVTQLLERTRAVGVLRTFVL